MRYKEKDGYCHHWFYTKRTVVYLQIAHIFQYFAWAGVFNLYAILTITNRLIDFL